MKGKHWFGWVLSLLQGRFMMDLISGCELLKGILIRWRSEVFMTGYKIKFDKRFWNNLKDYNDLKLIKQNNCVVGSLEQ